VSGGRSQGGGIRAGWGHPALLASTLSAALMLALAGCGSGASETGAGGSAAGNRASKTAARGAAKTPAAVASRGSAGGAPRAAGVPILMYHVINPPPAGAPFPGLYVPPEEFAAQMEALHAAGWHAVTMDQLEANWREGAPLPPGKPIVLSFDNGYQSQYTQALPVLRRLGWPGVENIQLSGLPPSQGGLSEAQVRGLIAAGWELDTQGYSHAELTALSPAALRFQVAGARESLRRRYGVPVRWFCYPSGHYDATVISEVKAAGFSGSTTVVPGWASPAEDAYHLPRIRVLGGTSPQGLLALIASVRANPAPPPEYR
jgi:peptidoglycan/xylan/chitin deacetylase (PgdA/CDA1 family)